jgi:hypothetical protein
VNDSKEGQQRQGTGTAPHENDGKHKEEHANR